MGTSHHTSDCIEFAMCITQTKREVQDLTNKHNHIVKGYNTLTSMQLYLSDYSFHQSQTDGIPSQEQVSGCKEEDNVVLFMQHVQ